VTGAEALEAFLGRLAARDASENTRRAYGTALTQYLEFLDERHADWRAPGRQVVRAYLAQLAERGLARRSISSRLAALRSFYRYARREGLVEADPWSAALTPRLPRRLPQVLGVADVERVIAEAAGEDSDRALVLRDVAIVETAYAAGLAELERQRQQWPGHKPLLDRLESGLRDRTMHLATDDAAETAERRQERDEHQQIQLAIIVAQRDAVIELRDSGRINDDALREVERELDLEELRMEG